MFKYHTLSVTLLVPETDSLGSASARNVFAFIERVQSTPAIVTFN